MTASAPAIARVAGLSADLGGIVLKPQHPAFELFTQLEAIRPELTALRAAAVAALERNVPRVAAEHRREVLGWKRDCFNGRRLKGEPAGDAFGELDAAAGEALRRLLALESERDRLQGELHRSYGEERREARRVALELAADPEIRRGLTLASVGLMEGLRRLGPAGLESQGRKERKAEASLLRYLSRAALKLSPYSTLTPLALAKITGDPADAPLRFVAAPDERGSLVRVKRYLLDQCCDQLFLHREVRRHLLVGLNPSVEELGPGSYRFLKPYRLEMGEDAKLAYVLPAHVKVKLAGPLAPFVTGRLQGRRVRLADLATAIVEEFGAQAGVAEDQAEALVEDLIRLGLVCLLTPWPGYHPLLEQNLLAFLHPLPPSAVPPGFLRCLEALVGSEESFTGAQDGAAAVRRIDELASALYEAARFDRKSESAVALQKNTNRNYYEDVFWSAAEPASGELLTLGRDSLAGAREAGRLVWQLANVFEARHEFGALIDSVWAARWPGRETIGVPELFAELKPLFEQFLGHVAKHERKAFDPAGLPAIAELVALRRLVRQGLDRMARCDGDGEVEVFPVDSLRDLLARVPAALQSPLGPCLYLQPRDREASGWVANRIFEGSGRMSSRFAALLPDAMRHDYLQHFLERGSVEAGGERLELLDMLHTRSNTVNAHWPQTRKVLVIPGESCDLEAARQLELRDLVVQRQAGGTLRLADRRGTKYLPCFLTPLQTEFMPPILKFLDTFGCNVRARTSLSSRLEQRESCRFQPRQQAGSLVVKRKRWILERDSVPGLDLADEEAFCALNAWRLRLRIPAQIYLIEAVQEPGDPPLFKPQYIDFRSPSFVALFQTSLRQGGPEVTIDEALPRPEDFPVDAEGRPRGVELMIESLALDRDFPVHPGSTPAMVAGFA